MKNFLFVIFFLTSFSLTAQEKECDCNAYRTGRFYILNKKDTCYIDRTEKRQLEFCNGSDEKFQLIVVWLKECKFILRDINYNPSTKPVEMRNDIVMTIEETTEDYYIVSSKVKGQKRLFTTVYRNKELNENEDFKKE